MGLFREVMDIFSNSQDISHLSPQTQEYLNSEEELQEARPSFPIEIVHREEIEDENNKAEAGWKNQADLYDRLAFLGPT